MKSAVKEVMIDHTEIQKTMRLLWTIICQWNGQPRRNEQIPRNVLSPKTESGRNRKYEHTDYQEGNWIRNFLKTTNKQMSRARGLHKWILPNI